MLPELDLVAVGLTGPIGVTGEGSVNDSRKLARRMPSQSEIARPSGSTATSFAVQSVSGRVGDRPQLDRDRPGDGQRLLERRGRVAEHVVARLDR